MSWWKAKSFLFQKRNKNIIVITAFIHLFNDIQSSPVGKKRETSKRTRIFKTEIKLIYRENDYVSRKSKAPIN